MNPTSPSFTPPAGRALLRDPALRELKMKVLMISLLSAVLGMIIGCHEGYEGQAKRSAPTLERPKSQKMNDKDQQLRLILEKHKAENYEHHSVELSLGDRQFFFVTVDRGSGSYLIEGYLYEISANGPEKLDVIGADNDRIMLDARVNGKRIEFVEMRENGEEAVIGSFEPE